MTERDYPLWIYFYLWFVSIVSTVFAIIIYTNPLALWSHWEASTAAGAFSLVGPAGLFCARQIGTSLMGVYTLLNKSRPMMEAYLVLRIGVDTLDGLHALIGGNPPVIYIGFGTAFIELVMLIILRRHPKAA